MIVKNEETMLKDCLDSVKDFVDEIILVDTGSTDGTAALAERHGAKVFNYPWDNSFCNARNYSIEKAAYEWVLLLDADERLVQEDGQKLRDFVHDTSLDGAHFTVYNFVGQDGSTQFTLHNALRLLRNNGEYHFQGDIHEQVVRMDGEKATDRFALTDIRLHHLGYLDSVVAEKGKRERNIPILLKELEKNPQDPFTLFNLGNEYMAQRNYQKALTLYHQAKQYYTRQEAFAPHLLFRSAMCFYNLKRYGDTIEILNEGLSIFPGCTDMEFLKGVIYQEWHRVTLALESFQKAFDMGEPHSTLRFSEHCGTTRPLLAMAALYEMQHDEAKAVDYYQRAIQLDSKLYSALYGIVRSLKKMMWTGKEIEEKMSGFFSDLSHAPNRILLADLLLSQKLCAECEPHLNFLKEIDGYRAEKAMLFGKFYFHKGQYEEAVTHFLKALNRKYQPRIFGSVRRESARLLFAALLILDPSDTERIRMVMKRAEKELAKADQLVFRQILHFLEEKDENLLEEADAQESLDSLFGLLKLILAAEEFDLFERLLYVTNQIDSTRVLLSLAEVYQENGFAALAASAVLRSIKELNTIDANGAVLLAEALSSASMP